MSLDVEACVDAVLARVGKHVRLAAPLGIGKPNHLLNALYRRAQADRSMELEIMTALTLQRPTPRSDLERRFLGPLLDRIYGDYPDLDYERDRVAGRLPPNVRVLEFYLQAGKLLGNADAQQDYISSNYTHVARDLIARGVNVVAQQVCRGVWDGEPSSSLSCNADLTLELVAGLRASGRSFALVAQVNQELPFMIGEALVPEAMWDVLVDVPEQYHRLFATPKSPVSDAEYMIGLYASTLIKDGGSLQIGIGSLGDALVYALLMRQRQNAVYQEVLAQLGIDERFGDVMARVGETGVFRRGLFAPTEMLVDGFMHLMQAGILQREVYDDVAVEETLAAGSFGTRVSMPLLEALLAHKGQAPVLDSAAFEYLQHWGVLRSELRFEQGCIVLPDGRAVPADLRIAATRQLIEQRCLGDQLRHGRVAHAGFFVGSPAFYQWLRDLSPEQRARIDMRSVSRINQLYGHQRIDELQRRHARFVNTAMMVTLSGAVVSDGLENGQVVSGVGGQYNFVAMGHALPEARSILQVRSCRESHGQRRSNILLAYGHTTIPRHLRDLVVTEYGIADLRARTDQEIIAALLAITDSQFQAPLMAAAKRDKKLARDWQLPAIHAENRPSKYADLLEPFKRRGLFPRFPFGTEMDQHETVLAQALQGLKESLQSKRHALRAGAAALVASPARDLKPYLERMGLAHPRSLREHAYQRLLVGELRRALRSSPPAAATD
jgi:acyl-CoA hydrolase